MMPLIEDDEDERSAIAAVPTPNVIERARVSDLVTLTARNAVANRTIARRKQPALRDIGRARVASQQHRTIIVTNLNK